MHDPQSGDLQRNPQSYRYQQAMIEA